MYKTFSFLLVSVLMVGCESIKRETHYVSVPTTKIETETVVVTPEDQLLKHPCRAIPAGDSLIDLAVNYNKNVRCIGLYREQLEKLKQDIKDKQNDNSN